jgi:tetratricopeptide (TPR) repeat protein
MAADSKAKFLRDAEKFVRHGKIPQAIGEYLKIIRTDAEDVLILNTIGDLHLRQGKTAEANKYFIQVADNYTRNHFLLKAIAVYKKILNTDSQNLEINRTIASLYAKQGLGVEARSQYAKVADLCSKQEKPHEFREAIEKLTELDPNNAAHHLKLAEICLAENSSQKAEASLANAGRAQLKARNISAALESFKRALEINPTDTGVLKYYLEASTEKGEVASALEQFRRSLDVAPDNLNLRELYGTACLAAGHLDQAAHEFRKLTAQDESRFALMFSLHKAYVDAEKLDEAATCFDSILQILLAKLETERAVEAHNLALRVNPSHLLTLTRLTELFSSTNDADRYLKALDRLAEYHLDQKNYKDALLYLEKILVLEPSSEKHLLLHRRAFSEAYPDSLYTSPVARRTEVPSDFPSHGPGAGAPSKEGQEVTLVSVDLLLTYGMKEQAVEQLHVLETRNPSDKEVRARLLEVYRQDNKLELAAEQCLLLAAIQQNAGDEIASLKLIEEAKQLAPFMVNDQFDLGVFALNHGIEPSESWDGAKRAASKDTEAVEVDLSGDLSEIFFKEDEAPAVSEPTGSPADASEITSEEYGAPLPAQPPEVTLRDQLQEIDFYLQLGFFDEARTKLAEIAKLYPGNRDLELRYQQLNAAPARAAQETKAAAPTEVVAKSEGEIPSPPMVIPSGPPEDTSVMGSIVETPSAPATIPLPAQERILAEDLLAEEGGRAKMAELIGSPATLPEMVQEDSVTEMFADLLDEVNSLTDQEIAQEDYETHFSLGIAYREMDLLEDAIREFLAAVKVLDAKRSPKEVIQCCGMLSTCFLEKQMPRSALRWCQTGLGVSQISSHEALALRYDVGVAHLQSGEIDKALEAFNAVFAVDPSYRDVAQRIDDLKRGPQRHAP